MPLSTSHKHILLNIQKISSFSINCIFEMRDGPGDASLKNAYLPDGHNFNNER
jgi:hypothetical protein